MRSGSRLPCEGICPARSVCRSWSALRLSVRVECDEAAVAVLAGPALLWWSKAGDRREHQPRSMLDDYSADTFGRAMLP